MLNSLFNQVAQPKVVIPLSKAEIKEPKFNVPDPVLYITDENTSKVMLQLCQ